MTSDAKSIYLKCFRFYVLGTTRVIKFFSLALSIFCISALSIKICHKFIQKIITLKLFIDKLFLKPSEVSFIMNKKIDMLSEKNLL